uniref:CSON014900 protein n=1 Tax=Culicoides sonorensis TaxID=179676 RepID=A0A336KTQ2_CULSO
MFNIDSLPTELMIYLFKFLSSEDRKIASEVCRNWYDIWMEGIFDNDRTLKFYHCIINETTAPAKILLKTERKYTKLILGNGITFSDNYLTLFKSLKDITKILFEEDFKYEQTKNFIGVFKNLKELSIPIADWKYENNILENLPPTVEVLTLFLLKYVGYSSAILKDLKCIIWHMPNLKELNLECGKLTDDLFEFIATSPLTHLMKLKINIDSHGFELLQKLEAPNLKEMFLEIKDHGCLGKLDEFISKFPKLKVIKLETPEIVPTTIHADLFKFLYVHFDNFHSDLLKPLQYLTELEELILQFPYPYSGSYGSCFFVHETYLNPNLKKLQLWEFENDYICHTCFENIIKSFPNLESFVTQMPLTPQHFHMIHQNFTKLKSLEVEAFNIESKYIPPFQFLSNLTNLYLEHYVITDQTLNAWPKMPHLRSLKMSLKHPVALDKFTKMIRNVSGLEKLTFGYTDRINNGVMRVIAENLKRLREVGDEEHAEVYDTTEDGAMLIMDNCKYIKRNGFPFYECFREDWKEIK